MSGNKSLGDPKQNSLCGAVYDVAVTATNAAQLVTDLLTLPTGYTNKDILEIRIAAKLADAVTDRGTIKWGSATPITPLAAGVGEIIPIRGGKWYLQRVGGSDVTVTLTVLLD